MERQAKNRNAREPNKAPGRHVKLEPPLQISELGKALQRAEKLLEQYKGESDPWVMNIPMR